MYREKGKDDMLLICSYKTSSKFYTFKRESTITFKKNQIKMGFVFSFFSSSKLMEYSPPSVERTKQ